MGNVRVGDVPEHLRSQTDLELLHSFHTGWGDQEGEALRQSCRECVDSKVSGREERLVGRVRRRRLLVAVRASEGHFRITIPV